MSPAGMSGLFHQIGMQKVYLYDHPERISPEQLREELLPALPEWRRQQALQYHFHLGQVLCAQAFILLKEGLIHDFNFHEEIHFDYTKHQKPTLHGHPKLHFNLSHCNQGILCVINDRYPVGCDIEARQRRIHESLLRLCCNEMELQHIRQADDPSAEFIQLWTIKEAVLKFRGSGLVSDLPQLLTPQLLASLHIETHMTDDYIYTLCKPQKP